ncbi:lysozyme [Emticicia sp. BO119]|uniref:lysozyme n=1 Tax=Emticicia sp. BO119 TaxID=2757768 RepID=UPI0015F1249E|nr:lysozyme [Emticicia sp. BO119]MBA4852093.1 lysozyme [Emticicia sp. BO119]
MQLSEKGLAEIKSSEAFKARPYQDSVGIWTIGYGSTFYLDGKRVSKSDPPITEKQAELLLLEVFKKNYAGHIPDGLNQHQYDAIASLIYNIGSRNFNLSTLKKKILLNPNDLSIKAEFLKWNKGTKSGKLVVIDGLTNRRKREADLYFMPIKEEGLSN